MTDLDDIPLVKYKDIFNTISVDNIRNIMETINNNPTGHLTGHLRAWGFVTYLRIHTVYVPKTPELYGLRTKKYEVFDIKIIF